MTRHYLALPILALLAAGVCHAADRGMRVVLKTAAGESFPLYQESHALVVGNGAYTKGWDAIPGATRDAAEVAVALRNNGFNVMLKTDLSKEQFESTFRQFCVDYGQNPDARLLFYYAGHGHTQKMQTEEDLGYLVMVDTPAPEKDPRGFSIRSVDMVSLVTQAKLMKARHVLFMFDSCFSGSILNLRDRITPKGITESLRYPVRQFITAGRANEPVPDHSKFKTAFLDLIEGRDEEPHPDGYITGEELGYYLKHKVPEYSPAQHPQYGKIRDPKLDKGDFVFLVRRQTPGPSTPVPPRSPAPTPDQRPVPPPTARNWHLLPRAGFSPLTGVFGIELRIDHIGVAIGTGPGMESDDPFISAGVRYVFNPSDSSWFAGVAILHHSWDDGDGDEGEQTYLGALVGYEWHATKNWRIALGIGGAHFSEDIGAEGTEYSEGSDSGVVPLGEATLAYSF